MTDRGAIALIMGWGLAVVKAQGEWRIDYVGSDPRRVVGEFGTLYVTESRADALKTAAWMRDEDPTVQRHSILCLYHDQPVPLDCRPVAWVDFETWGKANGVEFGPVEFIAWPVVDTKEGQ